MKRPKTILISLTLAGLIGPLAAIPALAIPPLPSSFYGTVQVDGQNVPDDTVVRALIDGQAYGECRTQTHEGASVYSLDVSGDDTDTAARDGGREGNTIQFEIGGVLAGETGTWHSGTNVELNLTDSGAGSLATPPPTPSPVPTQTPISPGQTAKEEVKEEPGGFGPSTVVVLLAAVVVVAAGVAAWLVLRMRYRWKDIKVRRRRFALGLVMALLLAGSSTALAGIPALPSSFWGTVKVNGENAPDGTVVRALIDGQVCVEEYTQTYEGESFYALNVRADDTDTPACDGGREGDVVQFEVGGVLTEQTGTWHSGINVRVDLTGSAAGSPPVPPATPSAVPTQTPTPSAQPSPTSTTPAQPSPTPTTPAQPSPTSTAPAQPSPTPTAPGQPSPTPTTPAQPSPTPTAPGQPSPTPTTPAQPSPTLTAPGQPSPTPVLPTNPGEDNPGNAGLIVVVVVVVAAVAVGGAAWAVRRSI